MIDIKKAQTPIFRILGALLLFLISAQLSFAQVIRISGKVTSQGDNQPLFGVNIIDSKTNRLLATTDADGRYATNAHSNATLKFTMIGAESTTIKVDGRSIIDVQLSTKDVFLEEAKVVAKRITDKVTPEPTEIEVKGNYFYVRTRVRVPKQMFSHDTRLVVQPILNNVTTKELKAMRPLVYDALEYNRTQDRMYDFDMESQDPLAKYVTIKRDSMREAGRTNDIIGYTDSIYVDNVNHEYSCDVYMAIEDYRKILYRDTTIIARGTVNPLRFLEYNFAGKEISDSTLYPKEELQLRDTKGEMKLRFEVGKTNLNMNDPQNREEMNKLQAELLAIEQDKNSDLRSLKIVGSASPEGKLKTNTRLAKGRLNSALNIVLSNINEEQKAKADFSTDSYVVPWEEVAKLLRNDGFNEEALAIEKILNRYGNIDQQGAQIRKLNFYKSLLLNNYLPELRKVEYELSYSILRKLNLDEIRELYQTNYQQLSKYEFFRLYREEADTLLKEKYCRQALEIYPSLMIAANDLQSLLIAKGAPDPDLLANFAGEKAPVTVNANHAIALITTGKYNEAAEIAQYLPDTEDTKFIKAVSLAFGGKPEIAYPVIAETGLRNEVLMLLTMKRNKEAWEKAQGLDMEDAMTYYIRAICLNRLEKPNEAYEELKIAFTKNPDLIEIARLDGDVNDLLPENN
jgi:hypothetical protein